MVWKTDNYIEGINALTPRDWEPLFELIPIIERTSEFGQFHGIEKNRNGIMNFPYWSSSDIVDQFIEIVYDIPIIIDFNWPEWKEGARIMKDEDFDFDSLDLITKCKLITAVVRHDRFCDGYLISKFESGQILKILKSMLKDVENNNRA